ncbi:MAG TPA: ADOP family duplicated permease, partial [Vicinamibacteria bacterium]|nr:ADOP family duplicated permease [Vicinamibacteria bacterium]
MTSSRRPFWYLGRRRAAVAREVDEELQLHLEMRAEELVARGMTAEEARAEALRRFGDLEYTRRYCREQDIGKEARMRIGLRLEEAVQDARISVRSLRRAPLLAATVLATVGLGIGATTAIFSAVDAALLRPLPYRDPDRLVRLFTDAPPNRFRFSLVDYQALAAQQTQFHSVAAYTDRGVSFADGTVAERVRGRAVAWTYFSLLGVVPALGRDFAEGDARVGAPPAAIVSAAFWRRRLGERRDVVGSPVRLDGEEHTVVGVLPDPPGPLERGLDVFVAARWPSPTRKGPFLYTALGRLRGEADRAAAAEELRAINRRIFPLWRTSYQDENATWAMMPLKEFVAGDSHRRVPVALAAVAVVWLIACANASSLLVARVTSRRRELAIRAALGASRGRVMRYLLVESVILALGAATLGAALAWALIRLLRDVGAPYVPRAAEMAMDRPVVAVLLVLTALSACLFGLVPALHGASGRAEEALRSSVDRTSSDAPAVRRTRRALVAAQFAIATPLAIVAALLLASLDALRRVDLGFDTTNMISGSISLPAAQYPKPADVAAFWDELQRRVAALPDVAQVAYADDRPPQIGNVNNFDLEDFPSESRQPLAPFLGVTPEYFDLLRLPLLSGRRLDRQDALKETIEAVVVDRAWEKRFFAEGTAVGKRFREGGCTTCPWTTVVGVVPNVQYGGLSNPDEGAVYYPLPPGERARFLIVRTRIDPQRALPTVAWVLRELDPSLPLAGVATMDDVVASSLERPRSLALVVAAFGVVALLLSIVGIYGVMAYYVQQHWKDISIRMALGGRAGTIVRWIVGQGMGVVAGGVVVGLVEAVFAARAVTGLLFRVGAA